MSATRASLVRTRVKSLDIVVSPNGATIGGVVLGDNDQPASYIKVVAIPDPKRREASGSLPRDYDRPPRPFQLARVESG